MPDEQPRPELLRIGVAVVEFAGSYLVGVRSPGQSLAGKAEFPGGKCLPGETHAEAAARECLEETGLRVTPVALLDALVYRYSHEAVDLAFWRCTPQHPAQPLLGNFRWVPTVDLAALEWPAANVRLIQRLTEGG